MKQKYNNEPYTRNEPVNYLGTSYDSMNEDDDDDDDEDDDIRQ